MALNHGGGGHMFNGLLYGASEDKHRDSLHPATSLSHYYNPVSLTPSPFSSHSSQGSYAPGLAAGMPIVGRAQHVGAYDGYGNFGMPHLFPGGHAPMFASMHQPAVPATSAAQAFTTHYPGSDAFRTGSRDGAEPRVSYDKHGRAVRRRQRTAGCC